MNETLQKLAQARNAESAAQARFLRTLDTVKAEARPAKLASDAMAGMRQGAVSAAQKTADMAARRPGTLIAVGSAVALLLLRKRIAKAVKQRIRRKNHSQQNRLTPAMYDGKTAAPVLSRAPQREHEGA